MTEAMDHCAKCGADLIGSRKFCTACGAPTVDPRAASSGGAGGPASAYGGAPTEAQAVNPFAQTALPARQKQDSQYGPPPQGPASQASQPAVSARPNADASQVSPLAVSNVLSERGAFQALVGPHAKVAKVESAPPEPSKGVPGTQIMPSGAGPASAAGAAASSRPRTQVMQPASAPKQPVASPASAPPGVPSSHGQAGRPGVPASAHGQGPHNAGPYAPAPAPVPAPPPGRPYVAPAPPPPANRGWGAQPSAPAPAAPAYGYGGGFGFAPGARVSVMWSNGQRYPATVQNVTGTQCLVLFPDGQQHWVDMQYVSPG